MNLQSILELPTAGRYARPGAPGDKLPVVLGDLVSAEADYASAEKGGFVKAVLIDTLSLAYCYNAGPSQSASPQVPPRVFDNKVEQPMATVDENGDVISGVWAYHPNADFEFTGIRISVIQFLLPPNGEVTVRCQGLADANGTLITNPIIALKYFFTQFGTWIDDDFDAGLTAQAAGQCPGLGFTAHWVADRDQTYQQWLTDFLPHYMADQHTTQQGRLGLIIDTQFTVPPELVWAHMTTGSPDDLEFESFLVDHRDVRFRAERKNLVTVLPVRYQYNWATGEYMATHTVRLEQLISQYGEIPPANGEPINLPGIRTEIHLAFWQNLYLLRIVGLPTTAPVKVPTTVTFRVPGLRAMNLVPGVFASVTCDWAPEASGFGWTHRLCKILRATPDVTRAAESMAFEALDTGLTYRTPTYALMQDSAAASWYLSIENGSPTLSTANPGIKSLNPAGAWTHLIRQSPDGTTWYVFPAPNGELVMSDTQPAGLGTSAPLAFIDRYYQVWDLGVTNRPELTVQRMG